MTEKKEKKTKFTMIDHVILENMAKIKLSPTQYRLIFIIWRYTFGFSRTEHDMSLKFLSNATGCDSRNIQRELKILEQKKIIIQNIKPGSYRKISFNENVNEWVGKTAVGEIDNGETDNATIGESDNQDINIKETSKEISKERDDDQITKLNPFAEYEKYFAFPSPILREQFNDWIDNSQFREPEAIICEVIKRAARERPMNPPKYIQSILINLHNMGLFTLEAVKKHNEKFDQRKNGTNSNEFSWSEMTKRPDEFFQGTKELTKEEIDQIKMLEDELPY